MGPEPRLTTSSGRARTSPSSRVTQVTSLDSGSRPRTRTPAHARGGTTLASNRRSVARALSARIKRHDPRWDSLHRHKLTGSAGARVVDGCPLQFELVPRPNL